MSMIDQENKSANLCEDELEMQPHALVDAKGLLCPEPVMLLHNAIKKVEARGLVKVTATDTSTLRDIPRFCEHLGHDLLGLPSGEHPMSSTAKESTDLVGKAVGQNVIDDDAHDDDAQEKNAEQRELVFWIRKREK